MIKKLFVSFLFIVLAFAGIAQTKEEIQKKQQELQKEIADLNETYNEIKKNKKQSLGALQLVQRKLRAREELVSNLNKDLRLIDDNIYLTTLEMNRMRRELDTLKINYAQSLVFAYKNRSNYDYLNFIFSATSFNDALKRVAYLKSYRQYRETQADNIVKTRVVLEQKAGFLASSKVDKNSALKEQGQQLQVLEEDKKEKDKVVQELKGKESDIAAEIKQREKTRKALSSAMQAAIRRELEEKRKELAAQMLREKKANEEAERKRKAAAATAAAEQKANQAKPATTAPATSNTTTQPPATTPRNTTPEPTTGMVNATVNSRDYSVFESTSEGLTMSLNFEKNKGHLPWPVDKGFILIHFGPYTVPDSKLRGVSDGLVISTPTGTSVKSVADGEVTAIVDLGGEDAVIIIHGKYFTTYSNLNGITVSRGQKVKAGTVLGKAATSSDGEGQITFMVSNERGIFFNPEPWLKRR
jgi:septal ring factor EnvC (AmiA/AmiB activator)